MGEGRVHHLVHRPRVHRDHKDEQTQQGEGAPDGGTVTFVGGGKHRYGARIRIMRWKAKRKYERGQEHQHRQCQPRLGTHMDSRHVEQDHQQVGPHAELVVLIRKPQASNPTSIAATPPNTVLSGLSAEARHSSCSICPSKRRDSIQAENSEWTTIEIRRGPSHLHRYGRQMLYQDHSIIADAILHTATFLPHDSETNSHPNV